MNLSILNNVQWTDPVDSSIDFAVFNIEHWLRSDVLPQAGQKRFVLMPSPCNSDTAIFFKKHLLYEPALTSINGYEESYAAEIEDFCVVEADITAKACILQTKEVWYIIEINSVVLLKDFASLVPLQSSKLKMFRLNDFFEGADNYYSPYYVPYNSWHSFSFNEQSAWGADLLIYQRDKELILAYISELDIDEQAIVTNYELDENESKMIWQFIEKRHNYSDRC